MLRRHVTVFKRHEPRNLFYRYHNKFDDAHFASLEAVSPSTRDRGVLPQVFGDGNVEGRGAVQP